MADTRLEMLARSFTLAGSRRDALGVLIRGALGPVSGVLLGGPLALWHVTDLGAKGKKGRRKKKRCRRNCRDRTCGSDGCGGSCGSCGAMQVCQGGSCCTPQSSVATCAARCGIWPNNCGQPVGCPACPAGEHCLSNGACAAVCPDDIFCGPGCGCAPSVEGPKHCTETTSSCAAIPQVCTTTADCPPDAECHLTKCGPGNTSQNRCRPLCSN